MIAQATGLTADGVLTATGPLRGRVVLAAGAFSHRLARTLGIRIPLETERGYHVMIENPESGPRNSMMASDAKMVVNWTDKGLRAAGTVEIAGLRLSATDVDMGNPHAVAFLPADVDLDGLDLSRRPALDPEPADGANIELVSERGPHHVAMRVHERGVGETRSCGTGVAAVAVAAATPDARTPPTCCSRRRRGCSR